MSLELLIKGRAITGIRPFNELPIDAQIWREAHAQHHQHRALHALASHRAGIVFGLEVVASPNPDRKIHVAPGVAIDSEGQTIVLRERVTLELEEKGYSYITLTFDEALDGNAVVKVGGDKQLFRLIEARKVTRSKELPPEPYVELARTYRTKIEKAVSDAENPYDPSPDEIDLLHRQLAFPHCFADIAVGEISYTPKHDVSAGKPNRAGLINLLREGSGKGFHLDFAGIYNPKVDSPADEPALLYVAGTQGFIAKADSEMDGLRRYLASGGTIFAEAAMDSEEFEKDFRALATKLGAKLMPVLGPHEASHGDKVEKVPGHPVLTSHSVFAAPPPGSSQGELLCDENLGLFFSSCDYGGAWQGDIAEPTAPDSRERIRQTIEFGLNVVTYAARRRRIKELARLLA